VLLVGYAGLLAYAMARLGEPGLVGLWSTRAGREPLAMRAWLADRRES